MRRASNWVNRQLGREEPYDKNLRTKGMSGKGAKGEGGSRSWRNNNPGNIEYGPYAKKAGAVGSDGRFAIFPDYQTGRKAQETLLFDSSGYRNLTLQQAIAKWAPSSENNVPMYIAAMKANPNTKMKDFSTEQRKILLDNMQRHEGWKPGTKKNVELVNQAKAEKVKKQKEQKEQAAFITSRLASLPEGGLPMKDGPFMPNGVTPSAPLLPNNVSNSSTANMSLKVESNFMGGASEKQVQDGIEKGGRVLLRNMQPAIR